MSNQITPFKRQQISLVEQSLKSSYKTTLVDILCGSSSVIDRGEVKLMMKSHIITDILRNKFGGFKVSAYYNNL